MPEENNNQTEETEERKYTTKDIDTCRPIVSAQEFMKSGDKVALSKALEDLYRGLGTKKEYIDELVASAIGNPGTLTDIVQRFLGIYQKSLYSQTIKDLEKYYSKEFNDFCEEDYMNEVRKVFNSGETYESVLKEYNDAVNMSKLSDEHKEKKEEAKKNLESLSKKVIPLNEFETRRVKKITEKFKDKTLKENLKNIYRVPDEDLRKKYGSVSVADDYRYDDVVNG